MNSFNPLPPSQFLSISKSFHYVQLIRAISSACFLYCFKDFLSGGLWHWTSGQWPLLEDGPLQSLEFSISQWSALSSCQPHDTGRDRCPFPAGLCSWIALDLLWLQLGKGVQMAFNQSEGGDGAAPLYNVLLVYKPLCVKHQRNLSYQRLKQEKIPGSKKHPEHVIHSSTQIPTERGGCWWGNAWFLILQPIKSQDTAEMWITTTVWFMSQVL